MPGLSCYQIVIKCGDKPWFWTSKDAMVFRLASRTSKDGLGFDMTLSYLGKYSLRTSYWHYIHNLPMDACQFQTFHLLCKWSSAIARRTSFSKCCPLANSAQANQQTNSTKSSSRLRFCPWGDMISASTLFCMKPRVTSKVHSSPSPKYNMTE